jgi:hypothetical protein
MRANSAAQANVIPAEELSADLLSLARARLPLAASWPGPPQVAIWYAAFAVYAGAVAVFSGPSDDRSWSIWAFAAYSVAALAAAGWRAHGTSAALCVSVAGALMAPLTWLATHAPATPDVQVVSRSAVLLLRHGTPYLPSAQIGHLAGPLAYNPYLPVMSVFGLPRAVGVPGVAGDPRLWLAAASLTLFTLAFRIAGRPDALRCGLFAVASPVVAFPLALGITDPPVLALACLTLALLSRASRSTAVWPAAIVLGVACAMKATAWPALPVITAMLAARDGARAAARFAAAATAVLFAALAPAALGTPADLIQNTVLFPLGLTRAQTPAASPLPGHLLATIGPGGRLAALALLIAAGLAVAVSLIVRPPGDAPAAARRVAIGLTLMFGLSPATRYGYFAYPAGLCGWIALCAGIPRACRRPGFACSSCAAGLGPRAVRAQPPRSARAGEPLTRPARSSWRMSRRTSRLCPRARSATQARQPKGRTAWIGSWKS